MEARRVGTHIIHTWSDDALKVVSADQVPANQWTHVAFTYDGSRKAAGVRVFINGQQKTTNVQADSLNSAIRTDVPLKIGQRHGGSILSAPAIHDLRGSSRPCFRPARWPHWRIRPATPPSWSQARR